MYGSIVSMLIAVSICGVLLYRMIGQQDLWQHFRRDTISVPWREILAFTVPLLSTDILFLFMYGFDVILLEYFGNITDVAAYRSVGPVARLNSVVFTTFTILYAPQASRLFARNDTKGINELYWKTATWIAVLTFPVFIASFSLAQPLTLLLFGNEYADSGKLLAILAVGYYVNAALGFNGTTLTIYRRVWYIAFVSLLSATINLGLNYLLIPRYGATGAAVGTATTLIINNSLKQVGLLMGTGVNVVDRRYIRVYVIIAASAVALLAAQYFGNLHFIVSVALAVAVFLLVVRTNRDLLDVTETFPELMRIPFVPFLLGKPRQ
jgi:O-antigen/teichoic acid export membrane protein